MRTSLAILSLAVAAPHQGGAVADHPASRTAARAFLATLGRTGLEVARLPFDHPARQRWSPSPGPRRPGLYVSEMSKPQRAAMHRLLQSALSTQGYLTACMVMLNQDLLAKQDPDESSGKYSLAVFGDPAADGPWSWRLGGHHLSLHFTYHGDACVATTPLFAGTATAAHEEPSHFGIRVLADREDLGRAAYLALPSLLRERARLATSPDESGVTSAEELARSKREGVEVRAMPWRAGGLVRRLAFEYANDLDGSLAVAQRRRIEAQRASLRFAWAGSAAIGREHYYRLRGVDFVLEFHYHDNHVHSLWRRDDDFGRGR